MLVIAVAGGLMPRDALAAQRALERARAELTEARAAITTGDIDRARSRLLLAQESTVAAKAATSGLLWRLARHFPVAGPSVRAVTTTADVTDQVARTILPGLLRAADGLDPASLLNGSGLRLAPLSDAAPTLATALHQVAVQNQRMADPGGPLPARIREGVSLLRAQLDSLASSLRSGVDVAELVPPLLGDSGARRYLVVIENPAEVRGTGGLMGAYRLLVADPGEVRLTRLGPDGFSPAPTFCPWTWGPDFAALTATGHGVAALSNSSNVGH